MDYSQVLLNSLASLGWGVLFPIAALIMFSVPVMNSSDVGRVVNNLLGTLIFIPLCAVTWRFVADKQGRYRWLQLSWLFYFFVRFAIHVCVLADVYYGWPHIPAVLNYLSTFSEVYITYSLWIASEDLKTAYRYDPHAEAIRQENVQSLKDSAQIAINIEHLASARVQRSKELVANDGRS